MVPGPVARHSFLYSITTCGETTVNAASFMKIKMIVKTILAVKIINAYRNVWQGSEYALEHNQ